MKNENLSDDRKALDALFIRDCKEYNAGLNCVNPYVGNMTVYGIPAVRAKSSFDGKWGFSSDL